MNNIQSLKRKAVEAERAYKQSVQLSEARRLEFEDARKAYQSAGGLLAELALSLEESE